MSYRIVETNCYGTYVNFYTSDIDKHFSIFKTFISDDEFVWVVTEAISDTEIYRSLDVKKAINFALTKYRIELIDELSKVNSMTIYERSENNEEIKKTA